MPLKRKITKEDIINQSIEIINIKGSDYLKAKKIASSLIISTKPIYQNNSSMGELKKEFLIKGYHIYSSYVLSSNDYSPTTQSLAYIKFAINYRNLFNFLFMSQSYTYNSLYDLSHSLIKETKIIESIKKMTGYDDKIAYSYHFYMWMAIHGLATMSSGNNVSFTDEELNQF